MVRENSASGKTWFRPNLLPRRRFLKATLLVPLLAKTSSSMASPAPPLRAAVIGHTGHGDYGHAMEKIFLTRENVQLVGVADPDEGGRKRVSKQLGDVAMYSDWRVMLENEKPRLVSIGMRHTPEHFDVTLGCLRAAAHVYVEKPFVTFLAQSDELLREAKQRNRRIAVPHVHRAGTAARRLKQALLEGTLGRLLEIRAIGKQDARAGGEDLMVLGTHLFDLMRLFAGDPRNCFARILQRGQSITINDRRRVKDDVGWVAGDDVLAHFGFEHGVAGSFRSREASGEVTSPWGLELVTEKALIRYAYDIAPHVFVRTNSKWSADGRKEDWKPMDFSSLKTVPPMMDPVGDWLTAIEEEREPECSGGNAAWAVEMVMAAYTSSLSGTQVSFPLKNRSHPLEG